MKLTAEKVSRSFRRGDREFLAVQNADLTLESGRLIVLEGRSGSGKTTLLNILAGLQAPSSGRVLADSAQAAGTESDLYGMEDSELSRFRNDHFGIMPQGQSAVAVLTVLENIVLPATIYGQDDQACQKALDLMEKMGITDLKDVYPKELSGGEMRRMAIARALVRKPEILFADEPTGDLDDASTRDVLLALRECAEKGTAVLTVTHEEDAFEYADRIFAMNAGKLE